ncbi:MAG: helicase-related protein [Lachnospiraceae bacterium]|nr:helicase-related protein [Lachnospiraceae bacterium]
MSTRKRKPNWKAIRRKNKERARRQHKRRLEQEALFEKILSDSSVENPAELYPEARRMHRYFILHIGDTNTGKTYQALQDMAQAESGLYLAPLRLLALEVQESMLSQGVLCSMTTGEEDDFVQGAKHLACTVEKMPSAKQFGIEPDVAVIDEAQMIRDSSRGWAWLAAVLGLSCERIHVCMSEDAEQVITSLIEMCGDDYEIVRHTRETELITEDRPFRFPKDVREHDALVVFSKKKVLAVASELERKGVRTSVIYGALPYAVRKEEMRKFTSGESSVAVCTDAIGMGMNLPVERIVFLESSKYDGKEIRLLENAEIRQIAGRAGRRGLFEQGYVNALTDREYLYALLREPYQPIEYVIMQMPESLIEVPLPLSQILEKWQKLEDTEFLHKADTKAQLKLCRLLEGQRFSHVTIAKKQMLALINIPFDEEDPQLVELWQQLVLAFYADEALDRYLPYISKKAELDRLEGIYRTLDLIFSFARTVHYEDEALMQRIRSDKEKTAREIMRQLKKKNFSRTCRVCGKPLSWDYPFSVCENCYESERRYRRYRRRER